MTRPSNGAPFARTICDCRECALHCRTQPGYLAPGDFERIARHLHETPEQARAHFWASPGAQVMDTRTGRVFKIGTITPRLERGRCVFLADDGRCSIHGVAPFGCAYFDAHQSEAECQRRSGWALRLIIDTPAYADLRRQLPFAGSHRPRAYSTP